MPPPGKGSGGLCGRLADCQQLLGGKLVYCQQPGAEIRGAWSPAHTHVAAAVAAPDTAPNCRGPQGLHSRIPANKKTQEAN